MGGAQVDSLENRRAPFQVPHDDHARRIEVICLAAASMMAHDSPLGSTAGDDAMETIERGVEKVRAVEMAEESEAHMVRDKTT